MNEIKTKVNDFLLKFDKFNDDILNEYFSSELNVFLEDYFKSREYFELTYMLETRKSFQILYNKNIENVLNIIEESKTSVIGLKGIFLQKRYYKNLIRLYDDLDLLVEDKNCYYLYRFFKKYKYEIKKDKFLLYNNKKLFQLFKGLYAHNVHSVDLEIKTNSKQTLSPWGEIILTCPIDLSCNLNVDTSCNFDNELFFKTYQQYETYTYIKLPDTHLNILYLISHILRHLAFYKHDSNSLKINIQSIVDVYLIIKDLGSNFNFDHLIRLAKKFNILSDVLFFFNLYNKMHWDSQYYNIDTYYFDPQVLKSKWYFILKTTSLMEAEDIIIGNYTNTPYLLKAINNNKLIKSQHIKTLNIKKSLFFERIRLKYWGKST